MKRLLLAALVSVVQAANNTLTPQEARDGYELLWNGRDFSGWLLADSKLAPGSPDTSSSWNVSSGAGFENGVLQGSADPDANFIEVTDAGRYVFTRDSAFGDFDLKLEWQAPENRIANSGVLYYFQLSVSTENNPSACEYQIITSDYTAEWTNPLNTAGSVYELIPLIPSRHDSTGAPTWTRPAGQWNQLRIISFGSRAVHYGNGLRLSEYDKTSPRWNVALSTTLLRNYPVLRSVHAGSFMLQDHGQKWMKFRNIRVKRLAPDENPWMPGSRYLDPDSVAAGDTVLVDKLGADETLFPRTVGALAPKRAPLREGGRARIDLLGRAVKPGPARAPVLVREKK